MKTYPLNEAQAELPKDRHNNNCFTSLVHLAHKNNLKLTKPRWGIQ
jgi:hypothetical protein